MDETDSVYKEVYVVFDLIENMYVRYLNFYEENEYTHKVILAKEFRTEIDAVLECKRTELSCFRVDKIYVLEY